MIITFQILAVILAGFAAYFLWDDKFDWAFAFVAFAVCSYFLGMRFQIKARLEERKAAETRQQQDDQ